MMQHTLDVEALFDIKVIDTDIISYRYHTSESILESGSSSRKIAGCLDNGK